MKTIHPPEAVRAEIRRIGSLPTDLGVSTLQTYKASLPDYYMEIEEHAGVRHGKTPEQLYAVCNRNYEHTRLD